MNGEEYFNDLRKDVLPKTTPWGPFKYPSSEKLIWENRYRYRSRLINDLKLYFVPSETWMLPLAERLRSILPAPVGLEIFAGTGTLSFFFQNYYNIPMIATDLTPTPRYSASPSQGENIHFDVHTNEASIAVKSHIEANFLVMCWPPKVNDTMDDSPLYIELQAAISSPGFDPTSVIMNRIREYDPALAAVLNWEKRGPIVFVGELGTDMTGSMLLHDYLYTDYILSDENDFRKFYHSLTSYSEGAFLFIPKTTPRPRTGKVRA